MKNFSEFLNTVPSFANFNRRELEMLEQAMIVEDYQDGHVFMEEGKAADRMYLIVEGEVMVTRQRVEARGYDELNRMHNGDLFGLISLVDHGPHSATCTAVGPVKAAFLPRNAFELLFKTHANVGYHFQQLIAQQLVQNMRAYTGVLLKRMMAQTNPEQWSSVD